MTIDLRKHDTPSDFTVIMLYQSVEGYQLYGVYDRMTRSFIAKDGSLVSPSQTSLLLKCCAVTYITANENAGYLAQIRENIRNKKLN